MKKIFFLSICLIVISFSAQSQAAKSIYVELGGPGIASINFDTRFGNHESGFGGRVGIGGFSISDNLGDNGTVIFIPIGVNYLLGKDEKNYFELGAGVTPVLASSSSDYGDDNFSTTFGHILFGYRLQPKHGGFTFRAFICPVFGSFGFVPYYGGVSFGYKLGN